MRRLLTLAAALAVLVSGCSVVGVVSKEAAGKNEFIQTLGQECPAIADVQLRDSSNGLEVTLNAAEDVTAGAFRESLDWIELYFAESKQDAFANLRPASANDWKRYRAIEVVGYVGDYRAFSLRLGEDASLAGQPGAYFEATDRILQSRVARGPFVDRFRTAVLAEHGTAVEVVLERLFLFPGSIVVKFRCAEPLDEVAVAATKAMVLDDLLQDEAMVREGIVLALVEYYVGDERTAQYAWDNLGGSWIEGNWWEHVFHGPGEDG